MGRALVLAVAALLVVGVLPVSAQQGPPRRDLAPGPSPQHDEQLSGQEFVRPLAEANKRPTLASALVQVEQRAGANGGAAGVRQAEAAGLGVRGEQVRVTVQADGGNVEAAKAAVTGVGGTVEVSAGGQVQALVPISGLTRLSSASGVQYVQPTRRLFPTAAIAGEEVTPSGATTWQTSGAAGAGVKIAVLDGDFFGYQARQANGDLPQGLIIRNFCSDGFTSNLDGGHGTGVAEIVYEMAPGAQLYLVCAGTLTEMVSAVDYMIQQGVKIVNHSRGIFNTSRADGVFSASDPSYLPESVITKAYNAGILWVNSSGNSASTHWAGAFSDTDSDSVHNFTSSDEGNNITIPNNGTVSLFLKWDEWSTTTDDFDLYLSRTSDGQVLAFSVNDQGTSGAAPTEDLSYTNQTGASLNAFISIVRFRGTRSPNMDLFVEGSTSIPQYVNPAGSLTDFGVSPRALVVGAACWQAPTTIESYSSRGPTINPSGTGVKPDITGLDGVSSGTFGASTGCTGANGFFGTSAAAPNVAGAAALVKDANPTFSQDQIKSKLRSLVTDAGASGEDATFGAGVLSLGSLSVPTASCPTDTPRISVSTSVTSGALQATLTASGTSNSLKRVVLGNGSRSVTNALLTFADGRALGTAETLYLPFGGTQGQFKVQRQGSGAVTVPFVAVDRCGNWPSFFGGGTSAGF
jgi:hypothetical protein